jgi:hypothetical protein
LYDKAHSAGNFLLLFASLVIGLIAVAVCVLTRAFLMATPAEWFSMNYSWIGWAFRIGAGVLGIAGLLIAVVSRIRARKGAVRKLLYRVDVAVAIIAIAFGISIPVILLFLSLTVPFVAFSNSVEPDGEGCLAMAFDLFDFNDDDDV